MRPANRGDPLGMPGSCQPVMDGGSDAPSLYRQLTWTMMAGDQEKDPLAADNRFLETAIDRGPCSFEVQAMKIKNTIGLDGAAAEPLIPPPVEGAFSKRLGLKPLWLGSCSPRGRFWLLWRLRWIATWASPDWFSRQRPDGRCNPRPKLRLFRAERSHAQRRPWEPGSMPRHSSTCRRPWQRLGAPHPRRCRSDWLL